MAIGTFFTLFFVPSLYVLFAKNREAEAHDLVENTHQLGVAGDGGHRFIICGAASMK